MLKELVMYKVKVSDYSIASAEASLIDELGTTPENNKKPIYYFNRIKVPKEFRENHLGSELLDKLLKYMRDNDCAMVCDINPYGDLSYEELEEWYIRHGMRYCGHSLWYNP